VRNALLTNSAVDAAAAAFRDIDHNDVTLGRDQSAAYCDYLCTFYMRSSYCLFFRLPDYGHVVYRNVGDILHYLLDKVPPLR